jgi:hypothetical protein
MEDWRRNINLPVLISETSSTGPNGLTELFLECARISPIHSFQVHYLFSCIWKDLIKEAIKGMKECETQIQESITQNKQKISELETTIKSKVSEMAITSSSSTPVIMLITSLEKESNELHIHLSEYKAIKKLRIQLQETRSVLCLDQNWSTNSECDSIIPEWYETERSRRSIGLDGNKSLAKQSSTYFDVLTPGSEESLDDRKIFASRQSYNSNWNATTFKSFTTRLMRDYYKDLIEEHGRVQYEDVDEYYYSVGFIPLNWDTIKTKCGMKRGKVMSALLTMDYILNFGTKKSSLYAQSIRGCLNIAPIPTSIPPVIHSEKIVVPEDGLKDADDNLLEDPVLYIPFEIGSTVHRMLCCGNHFCEDTIQGIHNPNTKKITTPPTFSHHIPI